MSYKANFWRGKVVGIFLGALFGIVGGPIVFTTYPEVFSEHFGHIIPAYFVAAIVGFFWSGFIGAVIGTTIGLLLTWSRQADIGTSIGLTLGGLIGAYGMAAFAPNQGIGALFTPLIGLAWGGFIGWGTGNVIERKTNAQ